MSQALRPTLRLVAGDRESAAAPRGSPLRGAGRGRADGGNLISRSRDIRLRILSLVILSALCPVLIVGVASYLTARSILSAKITSQLEIQTSAAAGSVSDFLEDRFADTGVFASAQVVAENLRANAWARQTDDGRSAAQAQGRLGQYLEQIRERYPLYESLLIVDPDGRPVASAATNAGGAQAADFLQPLDSGRETLLVRSATGPLFLARHPILGGESEQLGFLIAASALDELWRPLASDRQADSARLQVLDRTGTPLFDTEGKPTETGRSTITGWQLLSRQSIARYQDDRGRPVLGAVRFVRDAEIGVLVEIDRDRAFAATYRLRQFTLLVSVFATLLVTAIGFALVLNLTRPIAALIAGAKAASRGDLSQVIPVISGDQIGYLTQVFNDMMRTVRESRARLERLSMTDELTGLLNRRYLAERFEAELGRASGSKDPLSVLMLDFDRFKAFNDRFGHLRGDAVLRFAGDFLSTSLREVDTAARYGGEEFLLLLPGIDKSSARELAERLRLGFKNAGAAAGRNNPWVTVSIGVATFPEDGTTQDELVQAADAALYVAKRQGRDRVRVAATAGPRAIEPAGCESRP